MTTYLIQKEMVSKFRGGALKKLALDHNIVRETEFVFLSSLLTTASVYKNPLHTTHTN